MEWLQFSANAIGSITVSIISAIIIIYLFLLQNKKKEGYYLLYFFTGVFFWLISYTFIYSIFAPWSVYFWYSWYIGFAIFQIYQIQFTYHFIKNFFPRESRIAFIVFTILNGSGALFWIVTTFKNKPVYNFEWELYHLSTSATIDITIYVAAINYVWLFIILLRKQLIFAGIYEGKTFSASQSGRTQFLTFRNILWPRCPEARTMLITSSIVFLGFCSALIAIMAEKNIITDQTRAYVTNSTAIISSFIFVVLYVGNAKQPTTIIVKHIGISLVTVFLVISTVSHITFINSGKSYYDQKLVEMKHVQATLKFNDLKDIPDSIAYIVSKPIKQLSGEQQYKTIFTKYPKFDAGQLVDDNLRNKQGSAMGYRDIDGQFFTSYKYKEAGEIIEIGFDYSSYRKYIHQIVQKFVLIIISVTLIMLFLFPIFFRNSLVKPLNQLLIGVKKVNKGNLDVRIKIKVEDEIGFLSHSFNTMVNSIKKSKETLEKEIEMRKTAEKLLKHDALHDSLTGLPNRTSLVSAMGNSFARKKRHPEYLFAVLFIGLDGFELINDSLGHKTSDQLLIKVTERLTSKISYNGENADKTKEEDGEVAGIRKTPLRDIDTIARFGGYELVIFLSEIRDISDATRIANRIQNLLSLPFNLGENELHISSSVGIAITSPAYTNPDEMLRDADNALSRARKQGRGKYRIYDSAMHEKAISRLKLENDLQLALKQKQFEIYYQPILLLEKEQIVAFEALMRWHHPERGFVSPVEFIPVAEEMRLIGEMSNWVLEEAVYQTKTWQENGHPGMKISVNISGIQIEDNSLVDAVEMTLKKTGLNPESLILEVTENIIMADVGHAVKVLEKLKEKGVQLWIDDFGTGYSSLEYLRKLPLHAIKVDKTFVDDLTGVKGNRDFTSSIMNLGRTLKLSVLAEGVETADQISFLRQEKCDLVQGFFYSKPVPAAEATKLLLDNCQT